jgi:broad specificity phosphatase PhoE
MAPRKRLSPEARRRKRKKRTVAVVGFVLTTVMLSWFFEAQSTTTVMFVRHADTGASMNGDNDAQLNSTGRARADLLADFLKDTDVLAGVDAIYASSFVRTQQTAAPLAERLNLDVKIAEQDDVVGFMKYVLSEHKGRIVLVVTHSNLLGELVAELHGHQSVPEIATDEFDNLYIVSIPWFGKVKTLRLHYAVGWTPPYDVGKSGGGGATTN